MIIVTYDSNNSGGHWWLSDEYCEKLAEAGWNVHWVGDGSLMGGRPSTAYSEPLKPCPKTADMRWLGALACSASKEFDNASDAIAEWEQITGQAANEEGCNCCGSPHSFQYDDEEGERHYSSVEVVATEINWN
jgi:hypothetical protein